jgi:hypothetical protein
VERQILTISSFKTFKVEKAKYATYLTIQGCVKEYAAGHGPSTKGDLAAVSAKLRAQETFA